MTTVLPEPVAILRAIPGEAGVRGVVGLGEAVGDPGVAVLAGDLGDVDHGLEGLDLAEEEAAVAVGVGPVLEELAGGGGDADVAALSPDGDLAADVVDEAVLLAAVLGLEVGVEAELAGALLLGAGDGDEVLAGAAGVDDLVGDAVVIEAEVAGGLGVGAVEDGVGDGGGQGAPGKNGRRGAYCGGLYGWSKDC